MDRNQLLFQSTTSQANCCLCRQSSCPIYQRPRFPEVILTPFHLGVSVYSQSKDLTKLMIRPNKINDNRVLDMLNSKLPNTTKLPVYQLCKIFIRIRFFVWQLLREDAKSLLSFHACIVPYFCIIKVGESSLVIHKLECN